MTTARSILINFCRDVARLWILYMTQITNSICQDLILARYTSKFVLCSFVLLLGSPRNGKCAVVSWPPCHTHGERGTSAPSLHTRRHVWECDVFELLRELSYVMILVWLSWCCDLEIVWCRCKCSSYQKFFDFNQVSCRAALNSPDLSR